MNMTSEISQSPLCSDSSDSLRYKIDACSGAIVGTKKKIDLF